jgi:hypothetical protein
MNYIRWFNEIGAEELGQVGGKGANLGELTLPVCLSRRDFAYRLQPIAIS